MYRLAACGTFSGCRTSAFSTLNTIALAPIPSASVTTAASANPGDLRNCRIANRMSLYTFMLLLRKSGTPGSCNRPSSRLNLDPKGLCAQRPIPLSKSGAPCPESDTCRPCPRMPVTPGAGCPTWVPGAPPECRVPHPRRVFVLAARVGLARRPGGQPRSQDVAPAQKMGAPGLAFETWDGRISAPDPAGQPPQPLRALYERDGPDKRPSASISTTARVPHPRRVFVLAARVGLARRPSASFSKTRCSSVPRGPQPGNAQRPATDSTRRTDLFYEESPSAVADNFPHPEHNVLRKAQP